MLKAWIIAVFFTILFSTPHAQAHPHVFITPKATLITNDHFVSQINVDWEFDAMSSSLFLESAGSNTAEIWNLVFPETQLLANGEQTTRTGYYTYVEIDGRVMNDLIPTDFTADFVDGSLHCRFTLNINQTVGNTLKIGFSDPTAYNDFDIQRGNFHILAQSGATPVLEKQTENYIDKISLSW